MTEVYIISHPFVLASMMMAFVIVMLGFGVFFGWLLAEVQNRYGPIPACILAASGLFSFLFAFANFIVMVSA